jgi:hypothetical protein
MLAFVFLPAISVDSRCSALVPLTNTVLLLGAPMLPTWRVMISTYLHLEPFLLITYMLLVLDRMLSSLLILYYNFLCYNSDLHIIIIIVITNITFLSLLISLNCYYCYNILFRNPKVLCSLLWFPNIFVYLLVCILQLCAPAIYPWLYVASVHYVPMYICTVLYL